MSTYEQSDPTTTPGAVAALVTAIAAVPLAVALGRGTELPLALLAWPVLAGGALAWVPAVRVWPALERRRAAIVVLYLAAAAAILLGRA